MSDMECGGLDHNLTCILFPGVVKNDEKALQCLGGIRGISQVYSQPQKKRLGLSFQPDNPFVKKMYSELKKSAGVLLKIKVKKVMVDNVLQREVISTDIIGKVNKIYKFESMCDFQYLPLYREIPDGPLKCQLDIIIPSGQEDISFVSGPSPLYIVPSHFTRFDRPINYTYTDKRYPDRSGSPDGDDEFHNKSRTERGMPLGHWWIFNLTEDFPSAPPESYIINRNVKFELNDSLKDEYEVVKKCFEERPIWSLNLIKYHTKIRLTSLKVIVPCLAIFMKDGPWKTQWVRYGYDPRKEPASRFYQTLDFRLRHTAGVYSMVMTRDQLAHYKKADRVRQKKRSRAAPRPADHVPEGAVYFRPGMVPTQRQIFYQLCDVKLSEVEAILSVEPSPEQVCHEKFGWLQPDDINACRDHLFKYAKRTLLATHNADLKFDQEIEGSSDEDDNSDEQGIPDAGPSKEGQYESANEMDVS